MKIITLVENTSMSPEYGHKHGLSFYIETEKHKLLFDLGSDDLFPQNAIKLKVDISSIDTVIISHGHFDHGGALRLFLEKNKTAKIYIRKQAFDQYYTKILGIPIHVGLDAALLDQAQFLFTEEDHLIDEGLRLFSNVTERDCYSTSNHALFVRTAAGLKPDSFDHEQNLIIQEHNCVTLIAGCAHNGIVNIQKKAEELTGREMDYVLSGFHLINPASIRRKDSTLTQEITARLQRHKARYFTCHCTGLKTYQLLKRRMGDQISYLSAGSCIEL